MAVLNIGNTKRARNPVPPAPFDVRLLFGGLHDPARTRLNVTLLPPALAAWKQARGAAR
jgi:hypothetical protein